MSAPSWLRRQQDAPAASPSPAPYLPAPVAGSRAVRPLFPPPATTSNSPLVGRAPTPRVDWPTSSSAHAAPTAAEPRHDASTPDIGAAAPWLQEQRGEATERIGKALFALEEMQKHMLEEARADAVELAIALVRNLVGVIDGVSVDKLLEVAREALAAAGPAKNAVLRVHPDDLAAMQAASLHSGEGAPVELRGDAGLGKGDVVVDTSAGRIDGSRRARLEQLERSVRNNMGSATGAGGRGRAGDGP